MNNNVWNKNDSDFYPIDEFMSHSFSDSRGAMHLSVLFEVYSVSEHDESNNVRVVIGNNDHDIPFEHGGSLFYKGNIDTAKEIVENTIEYFNNKENVISNENKYKDLHWEDQILFGIYDHIQSIREEIEQKQSNPKNNLILENNMKTREEADELKWQFIKVYDWGWNERIFQDNYPDTPLPRADIENTEGFEEYREELKELRLDTLKKHWEADPVWDIETTEGFEEYHDELLKYHESVKQKWEDRRLEEIKNEKIEAEKLGLHGLYSMIKDLNPESNIFSPSHVQSVIDRNNKINQTADKMGFVQGVCECVAALGDDYTLGKKLLTEMNVNKDMAKKFANPETFKKLEQGIFAQKQEQKLEQTQGVKR